MAGNNCQKGTNDVAGNSLIVRVLLLFLLLVLAEFWVSHHLGASLGSPGSISQVFGILSIMGGILDWILKKANKEDAAKWLLEKVGLALSLPVLFLLSLAVLYFGLTRSSLLVVADPGEGPLKAALSSADDGQAVQEHGKDPSGKQLRYMVRTSPYGRAFRLKVDGYLAETFQVPPLTGLRVRPSQDLRRSPSVLLRPPLTALGSLEGGGEIIVWDASKSPLTEIARDKGASSSFLVGRGQPVPPSYLDRWRMELLAGIPSEARIAKTLLRWSQPKLLQPSRELAPGMHLQIRVISRVNKPVAEAFITLSSEKLIDVLMVSLSGDEEE